MQHKLLRCIAYFSFCALIAGLVYLLLWSPARDEIQVPEGVEPFPGSPTREIMRRGNDENRRIEFYGKVQGPEGESLPGSKVTYIVTINTKNGPLEFAESIRCDDNGRFHVSGIGGHFLTVRSIEKDGYKVPFQYKSDGFQTYLFLGGEGDKSVFTPDRNAPVVFTMLLAESNFKFATSESKREIMSPMGVPVRFDIFSMSKSDSGQIEVSYKLPLAPLQREWSLTIKCVDPNLAISRCTAPFRSVAPKSGYTSEDRLGYADVYQGGSNEVQWFFRNADTYGLISLQIYPNDDTAGNARFYLEVRYNTTLGSRVMTN